MRNATDCREFVTPIATLATLTMRSALVMPFDMAREQYASSVQAGLIERSLLSSAKFGRALSELENWMLGPWARNV